MEHYYSICQVSKLLNLTPQTLRFYESEGLIHPKKAANGYRQYTMENIREIQDIIYYRNVDMSLEEIRTIFFHTDLPAWETILKEKIKEEQEKIMRHKSYLNRLELFARSIMQSAPLDTPIIRKMPPAYILYESTWPLPIEHMDAYRIDELPVWTHEVFENALDSNNCLPEPSKILRIVESDAIENHNDKDLDYGENKGNGKDKNIKKENDPFDKETSFPRLELPECVNLLLPSPTRSAKGLNLSPLLDWCKTNQIRLETTIYSRYLFNATENGHSIYYMDLFCPIAK